MSPRSWWQRMDLGRPLVLVATLLIASACGASSASSVTASGGPTASGSASAAALPAATTSGPTGSREVTYAPFTAQGTVDPSLRVTARAAATCVSGGVEGRASYRCFAEPSGGIHDPCFARPGARRGTLVCPIDPATTEVVELTASALPAPLPGAPDRRPWAVELAGHEVCVLVAAAWGALGPFSCLQPTNGAPADCHVPVPGDPWWTAACQERVQASSPFTAYRVDTVWR